MKIYDDYLKTIKTAIAADRKSRNIMDNLEGFDESLQKGFSYKDFKAQVPEKRLLPSLNELAEELGLQANFEQQLGLHPDFAHLKYSDQIEKHYITSMFVDIKGSTNLFKRYEPETVLIINNTIQRAAIHTCLIFGGYVHRLQGDGLFVYYGRKGLDISTAVLSALQSSSVFTYFVKNDLKNLFNQQGIEDIYTRIGIDLGYDRDVIWAMAGIGEISEVTTCSLHTSLACKMQSCASNNGIVIGDNIRKHMAVLEEYFTPVCHRTGDENHRYIFRNPDENFNYTQYDFKWLSFLKRQDFIVTDLQGNLSLKRKHTRTEPKVSENLKPIAILSKPYYNL